MPEAPRKVEESTQVLVYAPSALKSPDESYSFATEREVYRKNGILCVYAEQEDSYASIALEFGLFEKEILKFNDLKASRPLRTGEVVYLRSKSKYASVGIPMYVFSGSNESVWEVCQRFGVKLKSVLKLNGIKEDYVPAEGDVLRLRK